MQIIQEMHEIYIHSLIRSMPVVFAVDKAAAGDAAVAAAYDHIDDDHHHDHNHDDHHGEGQKWKLDRGCSGLL